MCAINLDQCLFPFIQLCYLPFYTTIGIPERIFFKSYEISLIMKFSIFITTQAKLGVQMSSKCASDLQHGWYKKTLCFSMALRNSYK